MKKRKKPQKTRATGYFILQRRKMKRSRGETRAENTHTHTRRKTKTRTVRASAYDSQILSIAAPPRPVACAHRTPANERTRHVQRTRIRLSLICGTLPAPHISRQIPHQRTEQGTPNIRKIGGGGTKRKRTKEKTKEKTT